MNVEMSELKARLEGEGKGGEGGKKKKKRERGGETERRKAQVPLLPSVSRMRGAAGTTCG